MAPRGNGQGGNGQVQAVNAPVNANPINANPVNINQNQAGPVQAGPVQAGPVQAGPVQAGPVNLLVNRDTLMTTGKIARSNPLMRNTVNMDSHAPLILPENVDGELDQAYRDAGLEVSTSTWQRNKRVSEGKARAALRNDLERRETGRNALQHQRNNYSENDAMKHSDAKLVEKYGNYPINSEYINARYRLIKNKYYTLLPEKVMKAMSRDEMMEKLRALYREEPGNRNDELIRYYQSMIIINDFEYKAKQKEPERAPARNFPGEAQLRRQNDSAYQRNLKALRNSHLYDEEEMGRRTEVMKSVMIPGSRQASFRGNDRSLTDAKREGIREVLAYMYRNCCKSSESKENFVYKLTQAKNEELLFMFYLIEKDKMSAPSTEEYYTAITDYVPNLDAIKGKIVASRWKFWKRVGKDHSDDVINWGLISDAARYALKQGEEGGILKDHVDYSKKINTVNQELNAPGQLTNEEKRDKIYTLLEAQGNLLLTMYRSAGLSPDMPIELIRDSKLKERIQSQLQEFRTKAGELINLVRMAGIGEQEDIDKVGEYEASEKDVNLAEKRKKGSSLGDYNANVGKIRGGIAAASGTMAGLSFVDEVNTLSKTVEYVGSMKGLTGVFSILAIAGNIKTATNLLHNPGLSTADHWAKGIGVAGDLIRNTNMAVESGAGIVGKFVDMGVPVQSTWFVKDTVVRTADAAFSTTAGAIQFCTGCVSILAGALQTTSGAIQHRRAISSEKDIKRSRDALTAKLTENKQNNIPSSKDEVYLERFLNHQDRAVADQKFSAGVSIASGTLKMVGGALTVSGILAPIGGILTIAGSILDVGLGVLYARKRKRKTRQAAVDDALNISYAMERLREKSDEARRMDDDTLRKAVRQDALGELGYASYKEFFANICRQNAELLYKHVFVMPRTDPDYDMYLDALKSVGTKIRIPQNPGEKPFPTPEVIYSKLME